MGNKQFRQIEIIAIIIATITAVITFIVTRDWRDIASVYYGSLLAIVGFHSIVISSEKLMLSDKAKGTAIAQFAVRYVAYAVLLFLGARILGLHLVAILLGFISISFAVKVHTLMHNGEED